MLFVNIVRIACMMARIWLLRRSFERLSQRADNLSRENRAMRQRLRTMAKN